MSAPQTVGDVIASLPKFIKAVIAEQDRQNADKFTKCQSCLIATALRRMGYLEIIVGPEDVSINGHYYTLDQECGRSCNIPRSYKQGKPFYPPEVVGMVISLTLVAPKSPLIISDEPLECPTCEGSGQVPASGTDWEVADAEGKVECPNPLCGGKGYLDEA